METPVPRGTEECKIVAVNLPLLYAAPFYVCALSCRVETHTATLKMHETRFEEIGRLAGRISIVEETLTKISGKWNLII